MTDHKALLDTAIAAAKAAGEKLHRREGAFDGIASEDGRDIKLNADRAAEAIIITALQAASDIAILAEETGQHGTDDGLLWVVDPLDGSANYDRRIPICAVSIALIRDNKPILGVIHDFNHDETYAGGVDIPATLNGAPIRVTDIADSARGVLVTGLPVKSDYSAEALGQMAARFADWKKVRMIGSAAMAGAYVASGKAERYTEVGARLWDVAAAMAIAEAAGGRAIISDGPPDAPRTILIDNGALPL